MTSMRIITAILAFAPSPLLKKAVATPFLRLLPEDIAMSPQHDFDTDTDTLTADPELDEPRQYEVMLLNDDYTTMDFVVDVLMRFFNKDPLEAEEIMYQVHEQGSGVCGIYPFDIAESKVNQVTDHARANNYPLLCVLRPH